MKANKIVLVPKYKSKTILFKVIPYKSYKTQIEQKAQMKLISAFDFYNIFILFYLIFIIFIFPPLFKYNKFN